jgi:hypothetical protein
MKRTTRKQRPARKARDHLTSEQDAAILDTMQQELRRRIGASIKQVMDDIVTEDGRFNLTMFRDRPLPGFDASTDPAAPTSLPFDLEKHFLPAWRAAVLDVASAIIFTTLTQLPQAQRRAWLEAFQDRLGNALGSYA